MKKTINIHWWCIFIALMNFSQVKAGTYNLTATSMSVDDMYCEYNESETWIINTGTTQAIHISFYYNLSGYDCFYIYEIDDAGNEVCLFGTGGSEGFYELDSHFLNGKLKIVLVSPYNQNYANGYTDYTGFYFEYNTITNNHLSNGNAVIVGNLGIGVANPQTRLHINGAIRGGDTNGALRINTIKDGVQGNVKVGRTDNYDITTDRSYFLFDKAIRTSTGQVGSTWNLSLQTAGTTRMTILNSNGFVGIGTTTPGQALTVKGNLSVSPTGTTAVETNNGNLMITKPAASGQYINLSRSGNASWSIGTVYNSNTFAIGQGNATDASFTTPIFNITTTGNVGIGAVAPQYKLDVAGTIRAAEVKIVSINQFADFVFDKNYELPALKEVNNFIQKNGHLPNIPSAKEVKENGINLVEMQVKLLQKVEELTLYALDQQKHIEEQQKRIEELEKTLK